MDLDGSGRWRAPGLGVGAAAEGVADGRGAPQLPRWREQLPAGQVQDDKLLKLLQVRNLGFCAWAPKCPFLPALAGH